MASSFKKHRNVSLLNDVSMLQFQGCTKVSADWVLCGQNAVP